MEEIRKFDFADSKTVKNIINNYILTEETLVKQLYFTTSHGTTIGGFREDVWKGMFEQIIPKKFVIEKSVFIIDSEGRVSNEADLAIFDETYTPYIFRYGRLKFIPIEAVAVVVECKSQSLNEKILKNWAESIAALKTSKKSYTRINGRIIVGEKERNATQTQTRPLRILCCLSERITNNVLENGEKQFDIIVRAPSEKSVIKIEFDPQKELLKDWYLALNHVGYEQKKEQGESVKEKIQIDDGSILGEVKLTDYQVKNEEKNISLLSFNFQFNQLLMLINNPIPFPHIAYAKMFGDIAEGAENHE